MYCIMYVIIIYCNICLLLILRDNMYHVSYICGVQYAYIFIALIKSLYLFALPKDLYRYSILLHSINTWGGYMFKQNVINSFGKVKEDMNKLKKNLTEWIVFLNQNQKNMDAEILALRRRVEQLEKKVAAKIY